MTAHAARAGLARAALGLRPRPADARVGPLALRPHQQHAAARLRYALHHYRVALLADDVGLGKTAVALALLREAPAAVVVAPAALRAHWTAALHAAGLERAFITTESLGRPAPPADRAAHPPSLLVVDEAHHFRNPRTRRWRRLATLAAHARLLLLSATPIHNRPDDLAALFALSLGARARTLDAPTLARLVVRRAAADLHPPAPDEPDSAAALARPSVAPTVWLDLPDAPDVRAAVHALPPALAPTDGTAAPDLDRYTLLRLWASSDAALRAGLQRRLARALAVADALAAGHHPTRADLHALTRAVASDATTLQLSLLPTAGAGEAPPAAALAARLAAYTAALRRALALTRDAPNDARRATCLRDLRARHPDARIVAFSYSADTVRALYRTLAADGRVAMLTATGGRIASGPLSRDDVLARFAPLGQDRPQPAAIERIDLLLTTDVLSEGLDLRDASVVVHLDQPWTPARLAQRTGRLVRPGAPAPCVAVYAVRAPPSIARDLRLAAHARAKRRAASRTVGSTALEDLARPAATHARKTRREPPAPAHLARDRLLERWSAAAPAASAPSVSAVRCGVAGYLAVLALPRGLGAIRLPTLVARLGARGPTDARHAVARALAHLAHTEAVLDPPPATVRHARRQLARWARHDAARGSVHRDRGVLRTTRPAMPPAPDPRRALLARAARALHTAPPHARAALAAAAATLRTALDTPRAAALEAALRDAGDGAATDADWLRAAAAACPADAVRPHGPAPRAALRALVLFTV